MKKCKPVNRRDLREIEHEADLIVIGGGLAGVCCSITAARAGISVVLVQDRPVLGGNASSEVRLWILGATSHMGNNNRWSREGGVIDEILLENAWRNPEGNPCILDTIILEKVIGEPRIKLLLNTTVDSLDMDPSNQALIKSVSAFNSQNSTRYRLRAPLFCDASGDGIVGYLAGAAFRMGAEKAEEFGELFAPDTDYGELLGHSIYFYSRDTGAPVKFTPPSYALKDISRIPRYRQLSTSDSGCNLWWLEYGGALDTVHDTEEIKWELWSILYGVWNHIKNSGEFPDAENLTLEWVGTIAGKRESRRFEGDYMLVQQDIVEQRRHYDAVSFGGWSIDVHPGEGVYSKRSGCTQWHSKGVYQIPYRCMYSRDIDNLFLAGRITSASHVAFASTRVMATCAHNAQAVGVAAALCRRLDVNPRGLTNREHMATLQKMLVRAGQFIPHLPLRDDEDLVLDAEVSASSHYSLRALAPNGRMLSLEYSRAILLPVAAGRMPRLTFYSTAESSAPLRVELRDTERRGNFTPDRILESRTVDIVAGQKVPVEIAFQYEQIEDGYLFLCLSGPPTLELELSDERVTGVLTLSHKSNGKVARGSKQEPPAGIGMDSFEFWLPERRPSGENIAFSSSEVLYNYRPENIQGGYARPFIRPNAWIADPDDPLPTIELRWTVPQKISRIQLCFDTDFDHALESVLYRHQDQAMPFCVKHFRVLDQTGRLIWEESDNHLSRAEIMLESAIETKMLRIEIPATHGAPAAVFKAACYAD
jgi:hypothetical protein